MLVEQLYSLRQVPDNLTQALTLKGANQSEKEGERWVTGTEIGVVGIWIVRGNDGEKSGSSATLGVVSSCEGCDSFVSLCGWSRFLKRVGSSVNKMGNSHETREIKSLVH